MKPIAAILGGTKAVAVIAIPTLSSAVVVGADGRPRVVRLTSLELLPSYFPGSINAALTEGRSELTSRRTSARIARNERIVA